MLTAGSMNELLKGWPGPGRVTVRFVAALKFISE